MRGLASNATRLIKACANLLITRSLAALLARTRAHALARARKRSRVYIYIRARTRSHAQVRARARSYALAGLRDAFYARETSEVWVEMQKRASLTRTRIQELLRHTIHVQTLCGDELLMKNLIRVLH